VQSSKPPGRTGQLQTAILMLVGRAFSCVLLVMRVETGNSEEAMIERLIAFIDEIEFIHWSGPNTSNSVNSG
jgi:hypothetical protein